MPDRNEEALNKTIGALRAWCSVNTHGGVIPDYMLPSVAAYLLSGEIHDDGSFLDLVIEDAPLSKIAPAADDNNVRALLSWHRLLWNIFPSEAWKSRAAKLEWAAKGGTGGLIPSTLARYMRQA